MSNIEFKPLSEEYFHLSMEFMDEQVGKNFLKLEDLHIYTELSKVGNESTSFVALDGDKLIGLRLTFAHPQWLKVYANKLNPELWPQNFSKIAYFKSNFVSKKFQGKGIGSQLAKLSLDKLTKHNFEAIICHSWLESPQSSSLKYLQKLGFEPIKKHECFWYDIDYQCNSCQLEKCECSAMEMLLSL